MSADGLIFDVKEFSVHDGPGPRTTVFFKGCPLRCRWCHNPEGLRAEPQLMVREHQCTHCGRCHAPCTHPDCQPFGRCLHICPHGLITVAGQQVNSAELAARLLRSKDFWTESGGVTISGGEPLMQPEFLAALLDALHGVHRCVETSGFAPPEVFASMLARTELVLMDVKLADPVQHRRWTGQDNAPILRNLDRLRHSGHPCILRTPLIAGVTDTRENLTAIAELERNIPGLLRVELLPYNPFAGAKYPMVGRSDLPDFPERSPDPAWVQIFTDRGIPAHIA